LRIGARYLSRCRLMSRQGPNLERVVLAGLALMMAGCPSGTRPFIKRGFARPASVAVLPPNNYTNSLSGASYFQGRLKERLESQYGYRVVPFAVMDEDLRKLGITQGGQLGSVTPQEIAEAMGANALVYVDLLEFGYTTTGFLNVKRCKARIRIVDGETGDLLYSAEGRGAESTTAVSSEGAVRAGAEALGGQVLEKAVREPLAVQVEDALDKMLEWLPD